MIAFLEVGHDLEDLLIDGDGNGALGDVLLGELVALEALASGLKGVGVFDALAC